jgi:PAS domain S-box-containing protein
MNIPDHRPLEALSLEETRQLISDLRARQVELEAQNAALRKSLVEAELHENEGKLHAIIQGSPIPAFAIGKDHKIIHWNKALSKLSGIKAERVVGTKQQWRAFYSEARPCLADLLVDGAIDVIEDWYSGKYTPSELVADGYEATDFFPALGEGGKWLRFTAAAVRDAHGEMIGAFETLEDVSDRMQAQEMLRSKIYAQRTLAEANLRIEYILNAVHDGLWENDLRAGDFQFSKRMFTMLGYTPMDGIAGFEFLVGKIHPDDKDAFEQEQEKLLNGKLATWDTTFRMQAADGSWHYILSRGNCTGRDAKGRGCCFAGTHTDITERRLAEAALAARNAELSQVIAQIKTGRGSAPICASCEKIL